MNHRERALAALRREQPDYVPTFELLFQETERDFGGRTFIGGELPSGVGLEEAIEHNARLFLDVARHFEHSLILLRGITPDDPMESPQGQAARITRLLREWTGDEFALFAQAGTTFAIPADPMAFVERMYDEPEELHAQAAARCESAARYYDHLAAAGADGVIECSDYAMNSGPFLAPDQFAEFITPYLERTVRDAHDRGLLFIKHTDGDLTPVLDQMVGTGIDALHSIDPMAGMDIAKVKAEYGDRIALCGNVHCAHMQTGTPEEIRQSAEYCLEHAKPGGGYIFCTSNCVFRGMPLESYDLIHAIWRERRAYA
jgi:uroporphyrinogen decarboxylase